MTGNTALGGSARNGAGAGRVRVRDFRVDSRLSEGVADPVAGVQRDFPFGGQTAGEDDDTFKIGA